MELVLDVNLKRLLQFPPLVFGEIMIQTIISQRRQVMVRPLARVNFRADETQQGLFFRLARRRVVHHHIPEQVPKRVAVTGRRAHPLVLGFRPWLRFDETPRLIGIGLGPQNERSFQFRRR